MAEPEVIVYCDGACSPNPGIGGWGALLIAPGRTLPPRELFGAEPSTTNNRMELTAALMALKALKRACRVVVYTDSRYLRDAFAQRWLEKWQRNGWITSEKKPVLNAELWRELLVMTEVHTVEWRWVRGHAGDAGNDRADALAVAARRALAEKLGR